MWTERGQNRNQWAVDAQALHSLHCCDTINSPSFSHTSAEATASGEASPHNISEHKHWLWAITIMPFKFKLHFNWGSIQEAELQFKFESKEVDLKWIEIQSRLSHELSKLKTSDKMIDRQTDYFFCHSSSASCGVWPVQFFNPEQHLWTENPNNPETVDLQSDSFDF